MIDRIRRAYRDAALASPSPLARSVSFENRLLRIEVATGPGPFSEARTIDTWFFDIFAAAHRAVGQVPLPLFRGIDRASLARAVLHGIDMLPTDRPFFAAHLEKALEYGGDYPAILMIDPSKTDRPWRELRVDAHSDEHTAARAFAGNDPMTSTDGTKLWYSRLPEIYPGRASDYELAYAHYIPGEARDALIGYLDFVPLSSKPNA